MFEELFPKWGPWLYRNSFRVILLLAIPAAALFFVVQIGGSGAAIRGWFFPSEKTADKVTITNPHGSNIVVGPTNGPVNQSIVNPDLEAAKGRSLKDTQKNAISAALAEAPPATLFVPYVNSKEAIAYSGEFQKLFRARGWKFMHFSGSTLRPKPRVQIAVGWRGTKSASYLAVAKGLKDAKIDFDEPEFELSGDQTADVVVLDIGVIPMTDIQIAIDRDQ